MTFQIKRGIHSQGMLSLEQIHALNDKLLINLFANLESNELTRNFTYTCWLLPASCQQSFSSFGNEAKAKSQVKAHLRQHIAALIRKAEGKCVALLMLSRVGWGVSDKLTNSAVFSL